MNFIISNESFYRDSFGYDCARRRNLAVLDECTLLFVTGNLLHFLDLETNELSMKRSVGGSGISCIAVSSKSIIIIIRLHYIKPMPENNNKLKFNFFDLRCIQVTKYLLLLNQENRH